MKYYTEVHLADGRICVISNAAETDAAELTAEHTRSELQGQAKAPPSLLFQTL